MEQQVYTQLIRFLQAQNVSTDNMDFESQREYLTGEPLWYVSGNKVQRVPLAGFTKRGQQFKAPPMEVAPLPALLLILVRQRCTGARIPAICDGATHAQTGY